MNKYIDLAKGEDIIPCQLFCNDTEKIADIENAVICCHGFAGSKDSSSTVLLAGKLIKEHTNILVISL